jgi:cytosine deaminase
MDVVLDGATVAAVEPAGTAAADPASLDLTGFLLLPAPAEPHAHLDKAFSWDLIDPPMGDLELAIASWRAHAAHMSVDEVADRARRAIQALLRNGTTAIRSHVDVLLGDEPLRGAEALVGVREEFAGLVDIELVALTAFDTPPDVIEAALDLGLDLLGGAPHLAPEPEAYLEELLSIAKRRGCGVDLHTDESLAGPVTLDHYARIVRDWPAGTSLSAGHCVRLGVLPTRLADEIIDEVIASDIGIITLPITNLYLQGWGHDSSPPRGLTAVRKLLDRSARIGAGADNVRDPFNPVGRSDALETASLLVTAGHLTLTEAYSLVADGARSVMRLPMAGPVVGAQADFLAVRAGNLADAVATAPADRYVIHRGRLVSYSEVRHTTASATAVAPPIGIPV